MHILSSPLYILSILLLLVWLADWLADKKGFRTMGASLIVIILAAILANLGLLPSARQAPPLYDGIFNYLAPVAIFFLLLEVKLGDLRQAGGPMLILFILGMCATVAGCLAGYYILSPGHYMPHAPAIAGMYTGTYTGGSANLNAVALAYKVNEDGALFASVNTVDNILGTSWIMVTLFLPRLLEKFWPRRKALPITENPENGLPDTREKNDTLSAVRVKDIAALSALALASLLLSNMLNEIWPAVPSIFTLTTIALILGQLKFVRRLRGAGLMGYLLVLIFLAVVGAFCDLGAIRHSGLSALVLLAWVAILLLIHGLLLFGAGAMLKFDWDMMAVASNANVGGTATAAVCARSIGRPDLQLPGLLVGSLGNALGTYMGLAIAALLHA